MFRAFFIAFAVSAAALAQVYTTTCSPSTTSCVITVTSGTVTVSGNPPPVTPTITNFTPASGPPSGGTSVLITGTNFTGVTSVSIGGVSAASFSVTSTTQITAITSAGTGAGAVTVVTATGSASSTANYTWVTPPASTPVSDNFNEATLNAALWTFLNPVGDGSQSMTGTQLKLNVPGGANHDPAFGGMNNAVRVRQPVTGGDFSVITEFDTIPAASVGYQFEGLIIEQDATHYLRLQFGSGGGALVCNMDSLIAGVETPGPSVNIVPGQATSLWMGVKRVGSVWTVYYSLDGLLFKSVGSVTQALSMTGIGPFAGNYGDTTSQALVSLVGSFTNTPIPSPPTPIPPSNTVVLNPGADIQAGINSAPAGTTAIQLTGGNYAASASLRFKPAIAYSGPSTGTPAVITGTGGYPLVQLAGNGISIAALTLKGGGVEVTGSADKLTISGNVIRDILNAGSNSAAVSGIYQDAGVGLQISNASIDNNQFLNIYGPGELACNGQFPPNGAQPCDYSHNGMELYNLSNVTITKNLFDVVSGDDIHAFESISCGETGGPQVPQPNISVTHNTFSRNHRIPLEVQLCNTANFLIDSNLVTGTYLPSAWNIQISFASEGTGARITNNYVDGAKNQGPGWNINGPVFEVGGNGTVTDSNFATTATGSSGSVFYQALGAVMDSNVVFSNNQMCGPFNNPYVAFEPPCLTGNCSAFKLTANTVAPSCGGFPAPPVSP